MWLSLEAHFTPIITSSNCSRIKPNQIKKKKDRERENKEEEMPALKWNGNNRILPEPSRPEGSGSNTNQPYDLEQPTTSELTFFMSSQW